MKIFISAGDPSGDIHAAKLMAALIKLLPDIEFVGIGGQKMIEQGLKSIVPLSEMSAVGFWEVAKRYSFFKKIFKKCVDILKNDNINAFVPVDYPGFNIRLSAETEKLNIPVLYYIAPQLWAWGKNRAKKLAESTDLLMTVFPFEVEFFEKYGINTKFTGHPLLDDEVFQSEFNKFDERDNILALMPGSREQEIIKNLPVMSEIANIFIKKHSDYKVGVAVSPAISKRNISSFINKHNFRFELFDDSYKLMKSAKLGIVKTGTSNLEAALLGMPFVMLYKTSALSYFLGKRLVNMPYISLVNILSKDFVVKEYIQNFDNYEIAKELEKIINNQDRFTEIQNQFLMIRNNLGDAGASDKAAKNILDFLNK